MQNLCVCVFVCVCVFLESVFLAQIILSDMSVQCICEAQHSKKVFAFDIHEQRIPYQYGHARSLIKAS